jgi:DNA mismatch repair ATPase MutL
MEELALHILDIVENSLRAGATEVEIAVIENSLADSLTIEITDDGSGMDAATVEQALDPFFTTKSVRKVGLGLSLFREAARAAGGDLAIDSNPDRGTHIKATFQASHVDRQPLGDMGKTLKVLIIANPEVHFRYTHQIDDKIYRIDSADADNPTRNSKNSHTPIVEPTAKVEE